MSTFQLGPRESKSMQIIICNLLQFFERMYISGSTLRGIRSLCRLVARLFSFTQEICAVSSAATLGAFIFLALTVVQFPETTYIQDIFKLKHCKCNSIWGCVYIKYIILMCVFFTSSSLSDSSIPNY